jgi:hypothetical protein
MTQTRSFAVNSGRFAHETVDDEVIIIDMAEGNYFSLRGSAAAVWALAVQGLPVSHIASAIGGATGRTPENVLQDVEEFIRQLEQEGILAEGPSPADKPTDPELASFEYTPPVLDKFTEMQDLLTLDPIHEVDETGWPNPADKGQS